MESGKKLYVHGYHVYKDMWEAAVVEVLVCLKEPWNIQDKYTVAVGKNSTVIEHSAKKVSLLLQPFLLGISDQSHSSFPDTSLQHSCEPSSC